MRIIAGERRGHKFDGPKHRDIRPTSDLVRESIFNILRDEVEGREVIDLFAGTGALGLEALSRGAVRVIFVERDRENAALIRRNLATLRFEGLGSVVVADAYRWARTFEHEPDAPLIVFLDPPYRDYERKAKQLRALLDDLIGKLPDGSIVVAEAGKATDPDFLPDPDAWDLRRYGGTRLAVRRVRGESAASGGVEAPPEPTM